MKKNVKKLNKKLKAILCLCLALLFSFSAFLFAGCDKDIGDIGGSGSGGGGGENQRTFFENYVSGIAAVYANSEGGGYSGIQASQDKTSDMLGKINDGLIFNYGSGNDDTYRYSTNAPFYDSIRMLVTAPNGNITSRPAKLDKERHWNWNFQSSMLSYNILNYLMPTNDESYSDWVNRLLTSPDNDEKINSSEYIFPEYYSDMLQIALYEIMLGYSPTTLLVKKEDKDNVENQYEDIIRKAQIFQVEINYSSCNEIKKIILYKSILNSNTLIVTEEINYKSELENYVTLHNYLDQLKQEYLEKSRYVGLTKQNADKLIDYILTEIIGKELVLLDYNQYRNQPVNFRNYVETIAYLVYSQTYDGSKEDWVYDFPSGNSTKITYTFNQEQRENAKTKGLLNESELGSFMAKPATYVKYFPGESFFGDPDATDQFAGKPYAEYQSIVIVPAISAETTKDGGIKLEAGFVFNFMSRNKNLRIIPKVRYCVYNEETGTQFFYEFAADEINFSGAQSFVNAAGQTCYEDDFDFGVDISKLDPSLVKTQVDSTGYKETTYTVGFFKNKELLDSVVDETRLTDQADVQDFYKVVESKNGHGGTTVLNEKHINSSFFEIVFDIVKSESDPENTDYNFSLVLSNSLLYPGIY